MATLTCRSCSAPIAEGMRFCSACGTALGLARIGDAERRQLTVLFCDLVAFTALSERLDPEMLREVVQVYHAACAREIERFGGHLAQYLGDGVLVYFGYPSAHEDGARRAVLAGLAIVRALAGLNQALKRDRNLSVQVRIGVHTGAVVTGTMGEGQPLAVGTAPNIAARLQDLAQPDSVVISATTYNLVQGFFACVSLGPQPLKGVSQPVEAFRVLHETGVQSLFEVAQAKGLTPAVDRRAELELLLDAFRRVQAGAGETVWVVGDAGIGKSRLLEIFRDRVPPQDIRWLACRCLPYYETSALYPLIDLVQRLLRFDPGDTPAQRVQKLVRGVDRYTSVPSAAVPLLAALLSLPATGVEMLGLSPERQKERTFETLLAMLLRMSQEQPVVVCVEDLQWADPSTLDFLNVVLGRVAGARILVILTHRSTPPLAPAGETRLVLDRLPDEYAREMIQYLTPSRPLLDDARSYIVDKADGVPIFIEEMTRAVLETPAAGLATSIPINLRDLLIARLDRLGGAKELALLASVLGREFTYELLRDVSGVDEMSLGRHLEKLVASGVLLRYGKPPGSHFAFKHALILDAAYSLLLTNTRRHHHRRVAETFTARYPEAVELRPEVVARHFTEAGLAEAAVNYWLRAARRDVARSANVEAAAHARQGLDLLERLPVSAERDATELALQSTLGSATIALKGYEANEVERAFARAQVLCERLGNAAQLFRAVIGLWTYSVVRADYARSLELASRVLEMARTQEQPSALVHAHYCLAFTRYYAGEFAASHDLFRDATTIRCDDRDPGLLMPTGDDVRIHLLAFFALTLCHLGRPAEAQARAEEAIAFARKIAHPYGLSFALVPGAFVAMFLGDAQRAEALAAEGLTIAADKGYRYLHLLAGFIRGWAAARTGAGTEGLDTMRRCVEAARGSGARMGQTLLMTYLAETHLERGSLHESARWLREIEDAIDATGEAFFEPELYRLRARLTPEAAEANLRRALDIARRQENRGHALRATVDLARLLMDKEERTEACRLLDEACLRCGPGNSVDIQRAHALRRALA